MAIAAEKLYRLIGDVDWKRARETGVIPYEAHDRRDGFFHLSTGKQLLETAARHYKGRTDLLALEIEAEAVRANLKVELVAKRGEAFPHLYGELPIGAVRSVHRLSKLKDGSFAFEGTVL